MPAGSTPFTRMAHRCRPRGVESGAVPRRLGVALASAAAAVGLAACGGGSSSAGGDDGTVLAVTVDAAGDERQERAMDIADRYAPQGTFTLEQASESEVSTDGESSSRSSTVVVFTVATDVDEVVQRLRDEPHVLEVAER